MATELKHKAVKVFAPATVANVGSGFDIFGFALNEPGDEIHLRVTKQTGVIIDVITGDGGALPRQAEKNTAGRSALAMLEYLKADFGLAMEIHKKMPVGSGLGSSAASSVAGAFALNNLLKEPLSKEKLLEFAIEGEKIASGKNVHLDNIAACLYGGFILVRSKNPIDIIPIPTPNNLHCTVIHPQIEIQTSESRKMLKKLVPLSKAITQWANVAGVVTALFQEDYDLLKRSLKDKIAEPDRSILIPYYDEMKQAAMENGAAGFSISGSGSSVFAFSSDYETAQTIGCAARNVLTKNEIGNDVYISKINNTGPKVLEEHNN